MKLFKVLDFIKYFFIFGGVFIVFLALGVYAYKKIGFEGSVIIYLTLIITNIIVNLLRK